MNLWLIMLVAGLLTYGLRLFFILILGRGEMSPALHRALRFVPPAVLTAIIFPEMLMPQGRLDLSLGNIRLLAGLLAAFVAWRTRNTLLTIGIGMLALWLFTWLSG